MTRYYDRLLALVSGLSDMLVVAMPTLPIEKEELLSKADGFGVISTM